MKKSLRQWVGLFTIALLAANTFAVTPGVEFIGRGSVSGSASDKSGLTGDICQASNAANCVSKAILGGFGSDVTYTGHDNVFIAAPDRGPFDGLTDVPYIDRFHFFHITTDLTRPFNQRIQTVLLDTRFMRNVAGQYFVGAAGEFADRFDPEGIRVAPDGTFYVSDEYGTYVFQFDRQGNIIRRLPVPSKFFIANPSSDPTTELLGNTSGRQANRGMEGLAISPDGSTLYGMMQNALLQDNGLAPGSTDRLGRNNRVLKIDLTTGATSEYVYVLDAINRGQGACEILAINDHEFLVVERDNRSFLSPAPQAPTRKTIYKIDITGATDVSNVASLPATGLPAGVTAVQKSAPPFIDLLDPVFGLGANDANAIAEKIEGISWGPDLADGRHVLYVFSDNDLIPSIASQIFAFAIDDDVLDYEPQVLPGPLFPPGQVKKIVGGR